MSTYVAALEELVLRNDNFRAVLHTAEHCQLVVMSLPAGEEIGEEVHAEIDQFFRVERGRAKFVLDDGDRLVHEGGCVVVPAGSRHNVVNVSATEPLKLYTLYSPPAHPARTVQATAAAARAAESAPGAEGTIRGDGR
jgi:mannose-6-phosphate isomerase-like protein (cupin superfamily)